MHWDPNRRGSAAKILHHPYFEASNVERNAAVSVEFSAVRKRRPQNRVFFSLFFWLWFLFFAKWARDERFFSGEANSKMGGGGGG